MSLEEPKPFLLKPDIVGKKSNPNPTHKLSLHCLPRVLPFKYDYDELHKVVNQKEVWGMGNGEYPLSVSE